MIVQTDGSFAAQVLAIGHSKQDLNRELLLLLSFIQPFRSIVDNGSLGSLKVEKGDMHPKRCKG